MICVVIKGPTLQNARQQITEALPYADLIELRLDGFREAGLDALKNLRSEFRVPMIFTLRSHGQGGSYAQSEEQRLADIRRLASLEPEYLDIENHVSHSFVTEIASRHPKIKLILSFHDFTGTPEGLDELYREMRETRAAFYKIAVTARDCLDAMRFVCWAKKNDDRLIAISMGTHGQLSRIVGPIIGCPVTYASLESDPNPAPGQLSAKTLVERYRSRSLTHRTAIYGLIGDPVTLSISDETHNHLLARRGVDAVYVKIQVAPEELSGFLQLAKRLPFHGLSVTMPLKERILPFLDEIDPQASDIGAVNTLLFREGKICGFNTDGIGALNAIEHECGVKGKRIGIIGAGGAARAIAYESIRREARVTIVNRNPEKASLVAKKLKCDSRGLEHMPAFAAEGYDILINSTPVPLPVDSSDILSKAIVLDIKTKPKDTEFLARAMEKGCRAIYGYRMFVEQAIGQFQLWLNGQIDAQETRKILDKKALECISALEKE